MKVLLDIKPFWPKGLSLEQAEAELGLAGLRLNRRSLGSIRKGTEKGDWATLIKLSRYLSEKTGKVITINDLLNIQD